MNELWQCNDHKCCFKAIYPRIMLASGSPGAAEPWAACPCIHPADGRAIKPLSHTFSAGKKQQKNMSFRRVILCTRVCKPAADIRKNPPLLHLWAPDFPVLLRGSGSGSTVSHTLWPITQKSAGFEGISRSPAWQGAGLLRLILFTLLVIKLLDQWAITSPAENRFLT